MKIGSVFICKKFLSCDSIEGLYHNFDINIGDIYTLNKNDFYSEELYFKSNNDKSLIVTDMDEFHIYFETLSKRRRRIIKEL